MANDIGFVNESLVAQDNSDNSVNTAVGIADSGNVASGNSATDSFNSDSSTNTAVGIDVDATDNSDNSTNVADSGNDNSTNDSSTNVDLDATDNSATDSFNDYSDNLAVDIADSFNDNSTTDNSTNVAIDASDNSVNDSFNTDNSWTDESINAGVRQYNTGVNFDGGAAAAATGAAHVTSNSTIVDQSVNSNIVAGDNVVIGSASEAVVASAEGAVVDIDDSFNTWEANLEVADSFNTADLTFTELNTDIDVTDIVNNINVAGDDIIDF